MGGVLLGAVGVATAIAVSHVRAEEYQAHLQRAVDAATIAGARQSDIPLTERAAIAEAMLALSLADAAGTVVSAESDWSDGIFSFDVTAEVPTVLGHLIGAGAMTVGAASSAGYDLESGVQPLEIVFVLDASNSMRSIGGNFDDVKDAVERMAGTAFGGEDANPNVTATFLPYMDKVLFEKRLAERWIAAGSPPSGWTGCLDPRERPIGAFDHALDDTPPDRDAFVPAVVQNQPHNYGKNHMRCYALVAQPQNDIALLSKRLDEMRSDGTGRFDVALAWAWRALSPRWRGEWELPDYPADYGAVRKRIVWIADGYSVAGEYDFGEFAASGGRAADANGDRPGHPFTSVATGARILGSNRGSVPYFDHMVDLCRRIMETGIEIEVIMTGENDAAVPYFERCASTPEMFHQVEDMSQFDLAIETADGNIGAGRVPGKLKIVR